MNNLGQSTMDQTFPSIFITAMRKTPNRIGKLKQVKPTKKNPPNQQLEKKAKHKIGKVKFFLNSLDTF